MSLLRSSHYQNPLRKRFGEKFFRELPEKPGVYFFLGEDGAPLYIGKADRLRHRLQSYRRARPGQVSEHTLEMIDLAVRIRWELHESGKHALLREAELLHALRPPFNIAGTEPGNYLSIGIRENGPLSSALRHVDFRLSHRKIEKGFHVFGCFKHRVKVKSGYMALLRLLYASTCERARFHLPARICGASPPYVYRGELPVEWSADLGAFLSGKSARLLERITFRLLEKQNIPKFMYPGLQADLDTALEFFRLGPQSTRRISRELGLDRGFVSAGRMDSAISRSWSESKPVDPRAQAAAFARTAASFSVK